MNDAVAKVQADTSGWRRVGTVVGNAGTSEFTFILQQFQARVGDIVALSMEVPANGYASRNRIYVWARITTIERFNPFFPYEAAQELSGEGISLEDTILSGTRDQLQAVGLILGATTSEDLSKLFPLTYPVKPASDVFHPPADAIRSLLIGGRESERSIKIGSLIARDDVDVTLSAPRLVARHLAILAMTGGGKTVAARRIIRELIHHGYPLLILDPHGDYIGLSKVRKLLAEESPGSDVRLFYPELLMQTDGEVLIEKLIAQMTDGISEPQADFLRQLFNQNRANDGEPALDYIQRLIDAAEHERTATQDRRQIPTIYATRRSLRIVHSRLAGMRKSSQNMRQSKKLKKLDFEPLPNPFSQPEKIIRPGQVSILYLGGYDHVTQCSIAAITLETLFEYRANLSNRIPPFFSVIEEAHTFIPSAREGTQDAVSLPVIRRIITEGRKFGTGLMLISQRPSRLDETIVSQCNSYLILRLVNPRDQTFVRSIMENLTESDARMIPGFGPGQGIVSGQVVRFPLPVSVSMDTELLASELGDEDFFDQLAEWTPDEDSGARQEMEDSIARVQSNKADRRGRRGKDR
ncbi:ATP-binding protein [Rhizobium johnstonii]|uniref:ATP-binding protein n=1 Tax=Rhizobium johnstonii TaxID=3019933 RepID=UPI003F984055